MGQRKYNLPSINAMIAFEAVARLQGFARAAEELRTSQPAISRHIRNLEIRFGTSLFERQGTRVSLTRKGRDFYHSVAQTLDNMQSAVNSLARPQSEVTVVCSHSVSHLLLMPRYGALRKALGTGSELRLLTAEYNLLNAAVDTGADIVFEYASVGPDASHVILCEEEIKPVGTQAIVEQAVAALAGQAEPPPLLRLQKENFGWMDWPDWVCVHPSYAGWPVTEEFDSYVYLLEAAAAGQGLGLGWRSFVDSYLTRGALVEMPVDWHSNKTKLFARLTRFGQRNPVAHKCLSLLEHLGQR